MSRRVVAERQFAPLYLLLALLLLTFGLLGFQSAKNKASAAVFPDSLSQQDIKDIEAHVLRNKAQPIAWVRETNGEISVSLRAVSFTASDARRGVCMATPQGFGTEPRPAVPQSVSRMHVQHLHMPVGEIVPILDGHASAYVNINAPVAESRSA